MSTWIFELLGVRRLDEPSVARELVSHLVTAVPEFRPTRVGTAEPLRRKWTDRMVDDLESVWPDRRTPLLLEGDGMQAQLSSINPREVHSTVLIQIIKGETPNDRSSIDLLDFASVLLGGTFGLVHRVEERELPRMKRNGTNLAPRGQGLIFLVTSRKLMAGIPDLYWTTLLGPDYVELIDRRSLDELPADVNWLPNGGVRLTIGGASQNIAHDPASFDRLREECKRHLGSQLFYDTADPSVPVLAPVFDSSIAKSMRREDPLAQAMRRKAGLE